MRQFPLAKVYQLIEPGPVVLLATAHKGRANIMTMSWHMMVDFEPPLIACIVSEADYSSPPSRAHSSPSRMVSAVRAMTASPVT